MRIKITYCWECGYADQAVDLVRKLLLAFEDRIQELVIVPGSDGVFDVEVDGRLVHSKHRSGWFPNFDELKRALSG